MGNAWKSGWMGLGLILWLAGTAFGAASPKGWGVGTPYGRMWDSSTIGTYEGKVLTVEKWTPRKGMAQGVHVRIKTAKEELDVHLGPSWYVDRKGIRFQVEDKVTVTGSRITFEGKTAILAAEVKKGGRTWTFRDKDGFPAWSGRRGNRPKATPAP